MDDLKTSLFAAILALERREECQKFLEDLLTPSEITTLAKRWRVISLLHENQLTQREIAKKADVSLGTVSRASNVLKNGTGESVRIINKLKLR